MLLVADGGCRRRFERTLIKIAEMSGAQILSAALPERRRVSEAPLEICRQESCRRHADACCQEEIRLFAFTFPRHSRL